MRTSWCFVTVLVALSCAVPAHAQVTTVKVSSPVYVGVPATVKVGESGACGAVSINFGDRTSVTYPIADGRLPFDQSHTWQREGTFTVTATGQGNCTGTDTTSVTVTTFKPISPVPSITGYFGLARPGGVAGIRGKSFGTAVGSVKATLKKFNGETMEISLDILQDQWMPELIGVRWPDVSGVLAQDATVRVTAGDRTTNPWTVGFVPATEFRSLPAADVK